MPNRHCFAPVPPASHHRATNPRFLLLAIVPLTLLIPIAAPTTMAAAAPDQAYPEYLAAVHATLIQYPSLSEEEAWKRVRGQEGRILLNEAIAADPQISSFYGGAWYDEISDVYHVVLTSPAPWSIVETAAALRGVRVQLDEGKYDLRQLNSIADSLVAGGVVGVPPVDGNVGELTNDILWKQMGPEIVPER